MPGAIIAYLQTFIVGGVGVVLLIIALPLAFFRDTRAGSLLTGFAGTCCLSLAAGPGLLNAFVPVEQYGPLWRWSVWIAGSILGPLLCIVLASATKSYWKPLFPDSECQDVSVETPAGHIPTTSHHAGK